ncbi:MAG: hypothetical protein KA458_01630 [Saprospiraceae bacterium]|nr:hypothetical protein [Saprospiraceae bacterium]
MVTIDGLWAFDVEENGLGQKIDSLFIVLEVVKQGGDFDAATIWPKTHYEIFCSISKAGISVYQSREECVGMGKQGSVCQGQVVVELQLTKVEPTAWL